MAQTFFRTPFASSGTVVTIPEASQVDGTVSFTDGFGVDYQADPSDPAVLYPERPVINELFRLVMENIQVLQVHGFPDFITSAQNDGSPYSYDINAFVRWTDGKVYYSLANTNTADPTDNTKWALFAQASPFKTGDTKGTYATTLESGWVWENGNTIGNTGSGATNLADPSTQDLFNLFWSYPATQLPIFTSAGAPSTRGVSAASDWAALKAIAVPDSRSRTAISPATMGGTTDPGRITNALNGFDPTILANTGGTQGVSLTTAQLASHVHGVGTLATSSAGAHVHNIGSGPDATGSGSYINVSNQSFVNSSVTTDSAGAHVHTITGSVGSSGNGDIHPNVQPVIVRNTLIKL